MTLEQKRMRPYHPRRSTTLLKRQKQQLLDLQRQITQDIGSLIVLIEEGNQEQIIAAKNKAKSDFLKHGPELRQVAQELGGRFPKKAEEFLKSVDDIVHSALNAIDESVVKEYFDSNIRLEKAAGF